jgi:ABC-type proline/glycine betaine transport system permease subunit
MKISQYNWNWWFVSTLLVILVGLMIGMVAIKDEDKNLSTIILIVGMISMIPCLYIGCKPTKD